MTVFPGIKFAVLRRVGDYRFGKRRPRATAMAEIEESIAAARTVLRSAGRACRMALLATCGAAVALPFLTNLASAAEQQAHSFLASATPLPARALDQVRGEGLDAATSAGSMQLGIILWDEYRGKQPPSGGGIAAVSSMTSAASTTVITITTTGSSAQR